MQERTATGIANFRDQTSLGAWFDQLYPLKINRQLSTRAWNGAFPSCVPPVIESNESSENNENNVSRSQAAGKSTKAEQEEKRRGAIRHSENV